MCSFKLCMNHFKSVTHQKIWVGFFRTVYIIGYFYQYKYVCVARHYIIASTLIHSRSFVLPPTIHFFFYDKNTFNFLIITHIECAPHISYRPLSHRTHIYSKRKRLFLPIRWIKQAEKIKENEKLRDEQGEGYDKVVHHAFIETTTTTTTATRTTSVAFCRLCIFPLRFTFK